MHDGRHVARGARRHSLASQAFVLAAAVALVAACSSSSGQSSFGVPEDSGSSSSSSGMVTIASTPLCPGCTADGGFNGGVPMCPTGWMVVGSCKCYLPNMACNDPIVDCQGIKSVCLPENLANGNGNRCHCSCPALAGNGC